MNISTQELEKIVRCLAVSQSEGDVESGAAEIFSHSIYPRKARQQWVKDFMQVEESEISGFAKRIDDTNPIHENDVSGKSVGLQGKIATFVRIMGYISSAIADEIPCVMAIQFKEVTMVNPLYEGSFPTVYCMVKKKIKDVAYVAVTVKNGFEEIAVGTCILKLPPK